MTMTPMYALHSDTSGATLAAADFQYSFQVRDWVNKLNVRAGDKIEFREITVRPEADEVEAEPAFIAPAPPARVPADILNARDDDTAF